MVAARMKRMPRVFFISMLLAAVCAEAAVDLNGNLQSDLWEARFAATNLPPAADADGDGVPNREESVAGTDPFDSLHFLSLIHI